MKKFLCVVDICDGERLNLREPIDIGGGEMFPGPDDYKGMTDENKIIEKSNIIKFKITYPLTNHASFELTHEDGSSWTLKQFIEAVISSYKKIYEEEGEDPGHISGMLNRKKSHGKYGIWGHDIGDLVLEGGYKQGDTWSLAMGS
jgi:hypothetical protein